MHKAVLGQRSGQIFMLFTEFSQEFSFFRVSGSDLDRKSRSAGGKRRTGPVEGTLARFQALAKVRGCEGRRGCLCHYVPDDATNREPRGIGSCVEARTGSGFCIGASLRRSFLSDERSIGCATSCICASDVARV